MTDKTPKKTAENLLNTQAASEKETNTARDSKFKSRALPQADVLKARFKAGSIPLQTDFADLIDLANIGRLAVGGAEGQTGPANGFTLSSMGRLELKPNTDKGINVDKHGVAVKVNTSNGLKMTSSGIAINDGLGIEFSSTGQLNLKVKADGGFSRGPEGASVIPGEGITTGSSGVSVKAGNGISVTSSGVNVTLAKGAQNNGGGGQGSDKFTSIGSAGGLALSSAGLSVDAGNGIQIDTKGVSLKLAAKSGLSADETNGVRVKAAKGISVDQDGVAVKLGWGLRYGGEGLDVLCKPSGGLQASKDGTWVISGQGITVDSAGVGVKAGNGIAVTSSGVNVKLAKGDYTNGGEGHGTNGATSGSGGGLSLTANGLSVDAGDGMQINAKGVSVKLAQNSGLSADENNGMALNQYAWIRTMCGLHGADFYAYESGCAVFFCNIDEGCVAYVYGREGKYISTQKNALTLNGYGASQIMAITEPGSNFQATNMIAWYTTKASAGYYFTCKVKSFLDDNSNYSVSIKLISAP